MITLTRGNVLEAGTDALVNTVNTVGVMGKGIALQFKRAFPENYRAYHAACNRGEVEPGRMFVFDVKPGAEIDLLPGAVEAAARSLASQPEARSRFDRVARLIERFESPYGLELLASVHWVASKEDPGAADPEVASALIRSWTSRKATLFGPDHVAVAWERLADQEWIAAETGP